MSQGIEITPSAPGEQRLDAPLARTSLEYAVKISKYCNLRCAYCYEYNELGDKTRMSLEQLAALFQHAFDYASAHEIEQLYFVWHGGEPFLIPIETYDQIGDLQRRIFGTEISYSNSVQTNLTVLTDRHLDWLGAKSFFADLGVSFDVYGDEQRLDLRGRSRSALVLANIERLRKRGIEFGAIAVLARHNLAFARDIYKFYDERGIDCRILPFHRSAFHAQIEAHGLSFVETVGSLTGIFDEWLVSTRATPVEPLRRYIEWSANVLTGLRPGVYDRYQQETTFVVETDGSTYGVADKAPEFLYGNAFANSMQSLLDSPGRMRAIMAANERTSRYCGPCPYLGYCPSHFVIDATPEDQAMLAEAGCPVREVMTHVLQRIEEGGLDEFSAAERRG